MSIAIAAAKILALWTLVSISFALVVGPLLKRRLG